MAAADHDAIVNFIRLGEVGGFFVEFAVADAVRALKNLFGVAGGPFIVALARISGPTCDRSRSLRWRLPLCG